MNSNLNSKGDKRRRRGFLKTNAIYFLLCLVALLAILGSTLLADNRFKRTYQAELRDSLTTILSTTQAALDLLAKGNQRTIELIAQDPKLLPIVQELLALPRDSKALLANQQRAREYFSWLYQSGHYQGFFLIAPDLTNLASSRDSNVGTKSPLAAQPDVLERLWQQGRSATTRPMKSDVPLKDMRGTPIPDAPTMFAAAPIRDTSGKIIALVTLRMDPLQELLPVINASRFASTGESYLVDKTGLMLSYSRFERDLHILGLLAPGQPSFLNLEVRDPGVDLAAGEKSTLLREEQPLTEMANSVAQGTSGINLEGYRDYRGRMVVGIWKWDDNLGAGIAVEADLDQVIMPVRQNQLTIAMFSLLSALLVILLTAFGISSTRRYQFSKSRLESVLNNLIDGVIVINEQGIIRSSNPAVESMLGYTGQQLRGKNVSMLMPEPYASQHDGYLARYIGGGAPRIIGIGREVKARRQNGEVFPIELGVNEMYIAGERYFTGIIRDISERKEIEDSLQQEREFSRLTLDTMDQEIVVLDENGRVIYVNEAWSRYAGRLTQQPASSWIGLGYKEAAQRALGLSELETDKAAKQMLAMLRGQIDHFSEEIPGRSDTGEHWMILRAAAFRQAGQTRAVAVHQDITERKQHAKRLQEAKDAAENATKAKSTFLAAMSHEIRTPMNGVIGTLDILQRSGLNENQQELADLIKDSAYSLLAIIDDILDFSKVEAGRMKLERTPISPRSLAENVVETLLPSANKKGIELLIDCDPLLPAVYGDPVRLRQILNNLLSNAIKFTDSSAEKRGRVLISLRQQSTNNEQVSLLLQVTDNGIGISHEAQANLFKPFMQAEESITRKYGGTGLGLSICQRLVEIMGGKIYLQSEEGKGSTFSVELTLDIAPLESSERHFDLSDVHILLVGEDEQVTGIVRNYLISGGAQIIEADERNLSEQAKAIAGQGEHLVVVMEAPRQSDLADRVKQRIHNELPDSHFRYMVISRGCRRRPRLLDEETLSMDANAMRYLTLIRGVAAAIGRASLELPPPEMDGEAMELSSDANKARILIAEDNETNRKVLSFQVGMLGFQADLVENGLQALEALEKERYSLLITDCHMPEMDGYELSRRIRANEKGDSRIPILAITADAMRGAREKCLNAGMDDYLTKPLQIDTLREKLQSMLNEEADAEIPTAEQDAKAREGVINPATLQEALGTTDAAMLNSFYADYLASSEECIKGIEQAKREKQSKLIGELGHRLKSSSRMVGAEALANTCEALQDAGRAGDWKQIDASLKQIPSQFAEVKEWIENFNRAGSS